MGMNKDSGYVNLRRLAPSLPLIYASGMTAKILPVLALVALLASCHPAAGITSCVSTPVCQTGNPLIQTQLYFGLDKKGGVVSKQEWEHFVAQEIAPRFPEGFTIVDGRGFWLSEKTKKTISENSKLVTRIHDGSVTQDKAISDIIDHYKAAFAQEAVMRIDAPVCAAF